MKEIYNEDYFERGIEKNISGYSNYRWIPELTIPLAFHMIEFLGISKEENILDFGCAKGYLVKAFRLLNRNAFGYDISKYALEHAPSEIKQFILKKIEDKNFDWIICKDVLEHIPKNKLKELLTIFKKISKKIFIIVPLGLNGKYIIPMYENDITHIIKEPLEWWENLFNESGFEIELKSTHTFLFKKNWFEKYPQGNGMFILNSKK